MSLALLILVPTVLYLTSWFLTKHTNLKERVSWLTFPNHKFFWNVVLLIIFLASGVTGILKSAGYFNPVLNTIHDNFGVILVTLIFYHIALRFSHFTSRIKRKSVA